MSERENRPALAEPEQHGGPEVLSTHEALLERYLSWLQTHPVIREASAQPGRERTLQWAVDELRHTAATLVGLSLDDAEYELKGVLQEILERLGIAGDSRLSPAEAGNP